MVRLDPKHWRLDLFLGTSDAVGLVWNLYFLCIIVEGIFINNKQTLYYLQLYAVAHWRESNCPYLFLLDWMYFRFSKGQSCVPIIYSLQIGFLLKLTDSWTRVKYAMNGTIPLAIAGIVPKPATKQWGYNIMLYLLRLLLIVLSQYPLFGMQPIYFEVLNQ